MKVYLYVEFVTLCMIQRVGLPLNELPKMPVLKHMKHTIKPLSFKSIDTRKNWIYTDCLLCSATDNVVITKSMFMEIPQNQNNLFCEIRIIRSKFHVKNILY
ncbi:uncharacterized protein LOC143208011 [Lasioglossum baleicum]|uniref:uncharacterized protein LOC143208011 n=1 Tax=Lasioglossum baleicum TaxID=434251 RepID=UPI003FCC9CAB